MEEILIFGHKNPDTDSICSALVKANLETKLGKKVKAARLVMLVRKHNIF